MSKPHEELAADAFDLQQTFGLSKNIAYRLLQHLRKSRGWRKAETYRAFATSEGMICTRCKQGATDQEVTAEAVCIRCNRAFGEPRPVVVTESKQAALQSLWNVVKEVWWDDEEALDRIKQMLEAALAQQQESERFEITSEPLDRETLAKLKGEEAKRDD